MTSIRLPQTPSFKSIVVPVGRTWVGFLAPVTTPKEPSPMGALALGLAAALATVTFMSVRAGLLP